jgi:hypothetical protein
LERLLEREQAHRSIRSVLSAAARRYVSVLVFSETPVALSFLFGAAVVLLLLGTLLIDAHWLLVAAAAGLGFAAWRVRKRWISRYRLAQVLDQRLRLHDSLSTAWYLLSRDDPAQDAAAKWQIAGAEGAAAGIEPGRAFPVQWTSTWFIPASLAIVALGLFALRYGRSDRFDLRPSLLPLRLQQLFSPGHAEANEIRRNTWKPNSENRQGTLYPDEAGTPMGDHPNELAGRTAEGREGANALGASSNAERALDQLQQEQQSASEQQRNSSNSLLNRMQNALGGVMNKLQQAVKPGDSRAQKNAQNGEQSPDEEKNSQAGDANAKANSQQQAQSSESQRGDTNGQQTASQAQAIEKTNSASQLGNAKQPANESGDNSQSGAGRNNGRKDLRDAEQLKALGKLEEIIGKRSASVTGDMTIEKSSGKQQLKTDYTNDVAQHSDLGGEVNRDEVPPEYQSYIRAYMEAMHKQAPAPPK